MPEVLTDEERYRIELGARIAKARGPMSKSRLARALGIPRTSLILIERGEQGVQAYMLIRLAQELSVDPVDLLLGPSGAITSGSDVSLSAPPAVAAFVATVREVARTGRTS